MARKFITNVLSAIGSVALTTGAVTYADPALASPTVATTSVDVSYDKADARTPEGRASLDQRIMRASALACPGDDAGRAEIARCRADAVAAAHRALDSQLAAR